MNLHVIEPPVILRRAFCCLCRIAFLLLFLIVLVSAHAFTGATVPWITYEAETMTINGGTLLGPPPRAIDKNVEVTNTFEMEASGRQCVKLSGAGQFVQF